VRRTLVLVAAAALLASASGLPASVAAAMTKPAAAKTPAPSAGASSAKTDEAVKKLQSRYDATKDFTADFTQEVEVTTLGQKLKSSGQVFFKRPGKMRWEFVEPDPQTIVADGATLWIHQPEHHQVLKAPFRAAFQSATPLSFLFGVGKLREDFNASLLPATDSSRLRMKLVPKQDREIGTLVLDVDPKSYDIVAAEVTDPLGNVTRLVFTNMRRDVGLDDAKFQFVVPPGTDVVEPPANP
jgi:outer membrane lipoprotein carrier protein